MNRLETLKALKKLFSKDERWTQHEMALNRDGSNDGANGWDILNPCDKAAVCFCLLGGVARVTGTRDLDRVESNPTVKFLAKQIAADYRDEGRIPANVVVIFNDNFSTTIGDVRKLIDRGIRELSK